MGLAKVPAVGYEGANKWDHAGRTHIVQILVSYSSEHLHSLQFTYLEKNGKLHTSDIIGSPNHKGDMLNVITFKGGGEYVTKVEGLYNNGERCCMFKKLTIHTNRQVYNVFEVEGVLTKYKKFSFNFGGLNQFGGFHGSHGQWWIEDTKIYRYNEISSIGVYFKHLESLPPSFMCPRPLKQEVED